jgi:large subunit ribosomal protein L25
MASEKVVYSIAAEPRELMAKRTKQLRRQGMIPGVVYGNKVTNANVQVHRKEFEHAYLRAGSTTLVDLTVGDGGKATKVFIHDVRRDPINYQLTHIDFLAVNLLEPMTMNVALVLVGESPIVHSKEGLLLHQMEHLTLRALPSDIPSLVEVDISGLTEIDQAIHVGDITLPDNVTLLSNPDDVIAKINAMPVIEEEPAEEAEEGTAEAEGDEAGGEAEAGASDESES